MCRGLRVVQMRFANLIFSEAFAAGVKAETARIIAADNARREKRRQQRKAKKANEVPAVSKVLPR